MFTCWCDRVNRESTKFLRLAFVHCGLEVTLYKPRWLEHFEQGQKEFCTFAIHPVAPTFSGLAHFVPSRLGLICLFQHEITFL